jgi:hypothetical protein
MTLLAMLVWFLNPRQPDYKPAPLAPPSSECLKPPRAFVPSNQTDLADPALNALPAKEKIRALYRLNTRACTCGCQLSIAACQGTNPKCENSPHLLRDAVNETKKEMAEAQGKK